MVLTVIGALVGGAAFVGHTVGLGWPRSAVTAYLPADGTAAYEMVETTREGRTTARFQVTETARFSGVIGLLSTDSTFGTQLFAETYAERDTLRIWRTTSNTYNDPAAPYASTRVYRATTAVELLGESRPSAGYVTSRRSSSCPRRRSRFTVERVGSGQRGSGLPQRVPGRGQHQLSGRDR